MKTLLILTGELMVLSVLIQIKMTYKYKRWLKKTRTQEWEELPSTRVYTRFPSSLRSYNSVRFAGWEHTLRRNSRTYISATRLPLAWK